MHSAMKSLRFGFLRRFVVFKLHFMRLISAGENNRYGHPHEETLKRLEDAGVIVHSTKEEGAITVTTDGKKITVREYGGK